MEAKDEHPNRFEANGLPPIYETMHQEVSTNWLTLCQRRDPHTPVRRNVSGVFVLAASLLLGACAAADSGKNNDPAFFGGAGGGNNGGGATSGVSFSW